MIKDTFKYSGIFWIGDIPEKWRIKRIKDITFTKSGTTPATNVVDYYENGKYNWIRTTDLNDSELYNTEYKVTDLALEKCRLSFMPLETVLIAMYGGSGTIGKNAIIKNPSTINQSICAILPNKKYFNSNYLLYFLKYFRNNWCLFSDGARKDPNINQDAVRNLFIIYPTITEQIAIASYLNSKTSAIDKKIALLEQKTISYQQLRKSLINETICRGLNKNVKLKDSGIEWIGMIPEHWKVKRFKSFAQTIKGKNLELSDVYFENSLPNLSLDYLRNDEVMFQTFCYSLSKSLLVTEDDYIIIWDGAGVGEILNGKKGYLSSTIAKIVVNTKMVYPKYFFHLKDRIEYTLKQIPAGMGIPHLNPFVLNNFPCPYPPLSEQELIATYLDEKTQKIDKILSNVKTQIETLKELRKALINDVVTGKIKVSES